MSHLTNRRKFLQNSTAICGGLLLGPHGKSAEQLAAHLDTPRKASAPVQATHERNPATLAPLPPGAVEPRGWLKSWAISAANGITGHLDEYNGTFHEAWKGHGFSALGANADGTGWPLEQCSYWLDGAIRLGYMLKDANLIQKASARLDRVVNGVLQGGESFIYWRPVSAVSDPFNSWAHSHMGRALVAYYLGSGNRKVLEALVKVYKTYPLDDLPATFYRVSGAVNLDAMSDTYRISGDRQILDNMLAFAGRQSYLETARAWAGGQIEPGHNVIFYEHIRTPALLSSWIDSQHNLSASIAALEWNDTNNLLPMGVSSGEEYHAGIGATRNVETCDVAASLWTNLCLAKCTASPGYLDRMEQIFLNAGPAPVSQDFKTMSYYQRPNRYSRTLPGEEPANPGKGSYQFTEIGDPVLCCVGNLNRIIPNYVMHMWMATPDGGLAATLYGPSRLTTTVNGGVRVVIESTTAYPFEETIEILLKPQRQVGFPIYLRIPSWVEEPQISVNGRPHAANHDSSQFQSVVRDWQHGDRIRLHFPMRVRVLKRNETPYPQIPYFKNSRGIARLKDIHNPYASVFYGPLLFSLPIPEQSPNEEVAGFKSNYAINVSTGKPDASEAGIDRAAGYSYDQWKWNLSTPISLRINAQEIAWTPTELQPLPERVMTGTPTKIILVPYGCTKFGISMFPRSS